MTEAVRSMAINLMSSSGAEIAAPAAARRAKPRKGLRSAAVAHLSKVEKSSVSPF